MSNYEGAGEDVAGLEPEPRRYRLTYHFVVDVLAVDEADARDRGSFEAYNVFAGSVAEEPVASIEVLPYNEAGDLAEAGDKSLWYKVGYRMGQSLCGVVQRWVEGVKVRRHKANLDRLASFAYKADDNLAEECDQEGAP